MPPRQLTMFVLVLVANCTLLSPPVFADAVVKPVEAKLVAKGDGYLVHVLPRPAISAILGLGFGLPRRFGVLNSNAMVTHTSTETGKMQCLFVSGSESAPGPPMGIGQMHHATWRLLGVVVSDDRVYLLTWHARAAVMMDRRPLPPRFGKGQYDLSVFDASNGTKLASTTIKSELPKSPPSETYNKGPLRVENNKITVYKQSFQFDGKVLRPIK